MVRLLSAIPYYKTEGTEGDEKEYIHIQVHVKNTGNPIYRKVIIHYRDMSAWGDKSLKLIQTFKNHSLYSGSLHKSPVEFAVKYKTDDGIFWDNNSGENYKISSKEMDGYDIGTVGGNIALYSGRTLVQVFQKFGHILPYYGIEGTIYVKNTCSKKKAGFKVSCDRWATSMDLSAVYDKTIAVNSTVSFIEVWKVFPNYISIGDTPNTEFSFAAYLIDEEKNITYWDNNFEQNYYLLKSEGEEIK